VISYDADLKVPSIELTPEKICVIKARLK